MVQTSEILEGSDNIEITKVEKYDEPIWRIWKHKRYILAIMAFCGFMNLYALRTNLSVAIVDMTAIKNVTLPDGTTALKKEFEWDSTIRGYVLSSFFYGYVFTQVLGGYFAAKLGGSKVFGIGIATTSVFTLITPWAAKTNVYFLIVIRTIEGAFEGVTSPAIQEVWAHWAPPSEKSRLVSISISGAYFGAVIAMPLCSLIATAFGWETIFYVFGTLGLVWYLIWLIIIRDSPSKDSRIDPRELVYINESIRAVKSEVKVEIPWLKLLTSPAVLANTICLSCEAWGFYTLLTYLPQMMKSLLGFDLNQAGFISALPYLVMSINVQASGHIADFIISRKYLSTTVVRKLLICIGFLGQATFLLIAGYWLSPVGTPLCLIIAVGLGGSALSAMAINPLDIAPKFASVIFGMNNTIATIPGIVTPILTGYLVTDSSSITQWRAVFFISSGIYFFGVIVSMVFTTGVRQPWSDASDKNIRNDLSTTTNGYDNKSLQLETNH